MKQILLLVVTLAAFSVNAQQSNHQQAPKIKANANAIAKEPQVTKQFDMDRYQNISKFTRGTEGVGGGDPCEERIKVIRGDVSHWIQNGGHKYLQLSEISPEQYAVAMTDAISNAGIQCVSKGDPGFPVQINGTPKVCVFDTRDVKSRITCDLNKFLALDETKQYILIHHEFAGIAGIEKPHGDDSNYEISSQMNNFLVDHVVKKLDVKPVREQNSALSPERLKAYKAAFAAAISREFMSGARGPRKCFLNSGNLVIFDPSESQSEDIANHIVQGLLRSTSGQIDTTSNPATATFRFDSSVASKGLQTDVKSWITDYRLVLSKDQKSVTSVVRTDQEFENDVLTGELTDPSFKSMWVIKSEVECNKAF